MKQLLVAFFVLCVTQSFAATQEPITISGLLPESVVSDPANGRGSCEDSVACPDGVHTAYCKATGPYTRCGKWGDYGVRCVAWNSAGKYTVASQSCP